MLLQLFDRGERCAVQRLALKNGKPSLDPIEPRRPRRGEMEVDVWMFLEPAIALLMGVEIIEHDMQLAIREGGNHAVHEAEELDTAPPLGMLGNNPAAGDFERCKQGRGAVPLVIVALAGQGASVRELQVALRPLQRLDRRLLIDTENNRLGRRIDIETDHIGCFRRELRVIALAPGLAGSQIDVVLAQKAPNILNVNILQRHRQLDRLILSRSKNAEAGRYCNLIVAMMVDRLIAPRSKLGFVRAVDQETATTSLGDV